MEPDDLATSEKLEKLQSRQKRSAHRTTLEDIELEEEQLEDKDGLTDDGFATHKRAKRQAPYIIYPEILVIVDYDGYRLHGGDNLQVFDKSFFSKFNHESQNRHDMIVDRHSLCSFPNNKIKLGVILNLFFSTLINNELIYVFFFFKKTF